jgi:hypothetical protein
VRDNDILALLESEREARYVAFSISPQVFTDNPLQSFTIKVHLLMFHAVSYNAPTLQLLQLYFVYSSYYMRTMSVDV